jgi:hypothetical protein
MRTPRIGLIAVAALALAAAPARAEDLAQLIPNLFDQTIVLAPPPPGFPSHEAHFHDQEDRLRDTGLLINDSLVGQLATFPLGSSAGGFTYEYDAALGVFNRSTESFGPIYAERVQTLGNGKWNAGVSYLAADYDAIDDVDLDSGALAFPLFHEDTNHDGTSTDLFFEGDVIHASSRLSVETTTTVFFATYGVSDRLDLGVAVPVLSVDLDARAALTIGPIATGTRGIHRFIDGSEQQNFASSGSATGVGDVVLRGKYRLGPDSPFAAAVDLRLPTGDEDELLGSGSTQAKLFVIASTDFGGFSPHANLGYTISSGGEASDEINYALGFDWAAHPRLTVAVDAVGRVLRDARTMDSHARTLQFTTTSGGPVQTTQVPDLSFGRDDLNLVLGAAGVRWNVSGNLLISLSAIYSLSSDGLQDEDVIPLLGVDYSF